VNFCMQFSNERLTTSERMVNFQIGILDKGLSEEIKKSILKACEDGHIALGLFTSKLILREKFNGNISYHEVKSNDKLRGGILFSISVPAERILLTKENAGVYAWNQVL